jgi:hypothetical protein
MQNNNINENILIDNAHNPIENKNNCSHKSPLKQSGETKNTTQSIQKSIINANELCSNKNNHL